MPLYRDGIKCLTLRSLGYTIVIAKRLTLTTFSSFYFGSSRLSDPRSIDHYRKQHYRKLRATVGERRAHRGRYRMEHNGVVGAKDKTEMEMPHRKFGCVRKSAAILVFHVLRELEIGWCVVPDMIEYFLQSPVIGIGRIGRCVGLYTTNPLLKPARTQWPR